MSWAAAADQHASGVTPKFAEALPNVEGKSMIAVEVKLAPGEITKPHRHAKSAFIYAYVLEGTIRSQLEGEPAKTYRTGESWYESPGAHHVLAQNLSKTKSAKLLAIFVVDSSDKELTAFD
jgi:quercetin dioxygenase-like cupin family protein